MNKTLTVVIPTYNMEKYLDRCLTSLVLDEKRLREELEVLVVIDGAKDRSSEIAHGYQNRYPETFRVIDKENGNYGSCVNRGLKEAKGKYFRILDADDWFDNNALKKLIISLKEDDETDVVLTNYRAINAEGKIEDYEEVKLSAEARLFSDFEFLGTIYERLLVMHSITYNMELLRRVGLRHQEGISYTDIEYCYYPLSKAKNFRYVDAVLYQYFIGREGQTVSIKSSMAHYDQYYKVAKRALDDFVPSYSALDNNVRKSLSRVIYSPIVSFYRVVIVYKRSLAPEDKDMLEKMDGLIANLVEINSLLFISTWKKIPFVKWWLKYNIRIGRIVGSM